MGLVRAIGNAVPARAGYVVALPLLIATLEEGLDCGNDREQDNALVDDGKAKEDELDEKVMV